MTTPALRLSPTRIRELERLCGRLTAATGIAPTQAPLSSRLYRCESVRTWEFPEPESAEAWNTDWEAWISTGQLSNAQSLEADPAWNGASLRGWAERVGLELLGDEIRAGNAPFPLGMTGGRCELSVEHIFHASTLSWVGDSLRIVVGVRQFGSFGDEPLWDYQAERVYPFEELPASAPMALAAGRSASFDDCYNSVT